MRINLDEKFFSDQRINRLATLTGESRMIAEIRLIHVWYECYTRRTIVLPSRELDLYSDWNGVPGSDAPTLPYGEYLCRALLAEGNSSDGYRIKGVKERIAYLTEAAKHGKRSAEARRQKYGSAQPITKNIEGSPKVPSDSPEGLTKCSEPPPPPLPQRIKNKEKTKDAKATSSLRVVESVAVESNNGKPKNGVATPDGNAVAAVVRAYVDVWRGRYGADGRPDLSKAVIGQIKRFVAAHPGQRGINLVQVYLQMNDPWFATKCHDFNTLMGNITKVSAAMASGKQKPGESSWEELEQREKEKQNGTNDVQRTDESTQTCLRQGRQTESLPAGDRVDLLEDFSAPF